MFSRLHILPVVFSLVSICAIGSLWPEDSIPLPEHPRPDFQREQWLNLNGNWSFRFDGSNQGLTEVWYRSNQDFEGSIQVPFPWGSKLSGVEDEADIGWYSRTIQVPEDWNGQRVFLVIGACDWHTTAWLDGKELGSHQGGYTPFEFDLTPHVRPGGSHRLVLRVDDTPHDFKLEGKQGYGRAAGIWQTVYLEARPVVALETVYFTPDIDQQNVRVEAVLDQPVPRDLTMEVRFQPRDRQERVVSQRVPRGSREVEFTIPIAEPRLWSLDDPYLYQVELVLIGGEGGMDRVSSYFGMRKISVMNLPGTDYRYIALNNRPVYLEMTLDQAYHPEGYYTFPSDEFMRDEILRTKKLGLNGQRIHIKVEVPRKLYWADRLGVLIMADVPNVWGPPGEKARAEHEKALRGMIRRDYNHPAIFSWVIFNETWGLRTPVGRDADRLEYLPETQAWVERLYHEVKQLDPTRLVEDNSANREDHVATDINSWHAYLPGYLWREKLDQVSKDTYPGSPWNFVEGRSQQEQPMMNSECGNVWGYRGSTGDVDWSWDYHIMINEFRRHPKAAGWLYTEHHDVINEWNGYYQYDRSEKYTGMGELVPGMSLRDLHGPFYLASERELFREVRPGQVVQVPLFASFMTDQPLELPLKIKAELYGWDTLGEKEAYSSYETSIPYAPWMNREIAPLPVKMPDKPVLAILSFQLEDSTGLVLHRNFTTYLVAEGTSPRDERISREGRPIRVLRVRPDELTDSRWTLRQWNVMQGLKVNGAGSGYFEYRINIPEDLDPDQVAEASFRIEVSSKELFAKDRQGAGEQSGDFMRGRGTHINSLNPNSYPMTDDTRFPSLVRVHIGTRAAGDHYLADDSADHRGILSWASQKPGERREAELHEAGSYGELLTVPVSPGDLREAANQGYLLIRLEVEGSLPGGLAVYGERFGRYPVDPSLVLVLND